MPLTTTHRDALPFNGPGGLPFTLLSGRRDWVMAPVKRPTMEMHNFWSTRRPRSISANADDEPGHIGNEQQHDKKDEEEQERVPAHLVPRGLSNQNAPISRFIPTGGVMYHGDRTSITQLHERRHASDEIRPRRA